MLLFAWFAFTAHLGLAASTWMDSQALELRALVTSNAGFLAFTSTEFKLRNPSSKLRNPSRRRLHPTSTLASWHPSPRNPSINHHASPSHPPQRDPSIEFRSHQSSTPVRRIHLQEIQASHFGHFNPPSTSNWRRSMRSKSHHLRVIHVCCEQWSRMRARARTDLLQMRCNCQVRAGARFQWERARAPSESEGAGAPSESGRWRQVRARACARLEHAAADFARARGLTQAKLSWNSMSCPQKCKKIRDSLTYPKIFLGITWYK